MDKNLICPNCNKRKIKKHFNSKWCEVCSAQFKKRPKNTLTDNQIEGARRRLHKMPRDQIAKEIGCSLSNLKRWAHKENIRLAFYNRWVINPEFVNKVCRYFEANGKRKTLEKYPDINFRSIVERYAISCRQSRWKFEQIIELIKMRGLIDPKSQAKYFNRPFANKGSIVSFWQKRYKYNTSYLNGLPFYIAKKYIYSNAPTIRPFKLLDKKIILWCDCANYIKEDIPDYIKESILVMSKFQKWIFKTKKVRKEVLKIIKERGAL